MKTLTQLSKEIQENPERAQELLVTFQTNHSEIRSFLFSLQELPVYIVPALIESFATKFRGDDPKTLDELVRQTWGVNALFTVSDRDGFNINYTYVGLSTSGKALCRPDNSNLVIELNLDTEIKNVF